MPQEETDDFGTYTILPTNRAKHDELGIRTYEISYPEHIVLMLPGFKRSSAEIKFKRLAEEFARRGIASAMIDLNRQGRQTFLSFGEMVEDIRQAENYLAHTMGWEVSGYVGHDLGAALAIEHIRQRSYRERKFRPRHIAFLAPALNQQKLLRYWFFQRHEPGKNWSWFQKRWSAEEKEWEKVFHDDRQRPVYTDTLSDCDYCYDAGSFDRIALHVHGTSDQIVPRESLSFGFSRQIIIPHGDHELETPEFLAQWASSIAEHFMIDHYQKSRKR